MLRLILIISFLLCIIQLNGQHSDERDNQSSDINSLNDAIIKEVNTNFTFDFDKSTNKVKVKESASVRFTSLKPGNTVYFGISYNDNSHITKAKSLGNRFDKVCGNYRPNWVFHSDDMLCIYGIYCSEANEIKTFTYEKEYDDIRYFTAYYFNERYKVEKNVVRFEVPEGLDIDFKEFNAQGYNLKSSKNSESKDKITMVEYQCENLSGISREEMYVPNHSFVNPHLIIVPKSYKNKTTNISIFSTINDFYTWSHKMVSYTSNETILLKPFLDDLLKDKSNDEEKIKAIYYWVQDHIRYLAFEEGLRGYIPDDAEKVFTRKFSDCKGKANLLKTLLKLAGYDARLTWIGTNDIRYDFSTPTLVTCNHMVCTLIFKGKHYLLDATDNYLAFDRNPDYLQGKQALIEDGDHYILDTIPVSAITDNLVFNRHHYVLDNDALKGDVEVEFNGERKEGLLSKINGTRSDEQTKFLKDVIAREDPKVSVTGISTSDLHNREIPLILKANISVKGNVMSFENNLFVNPDPFEDLSSFTVKSDRKNPLDLSIRICRKTEVSIDIPQGYEISKIPSNQTFSNDFIDFTITYAIEGNKIKYVKTIKTFKRIVPKENLSEWNAALKQLKRSSSQAFVLNKVKL